ncbi:polyhydroxyalkanoate depolymerase [Aestuariispira insulae]|uniref:Poly(3-hydroxybutyrate) depolymerase n=1 Tax=Aestuariispira insulae TaxID=1461337 RepID=A0A3D9HVY8_9PROT|nr:polyhydroxyalkanoate depolymerase [Aestuariispira insulae]RED53674.1 poly(3-hydroxybutyrate) depolymerase [Aestuariispira insulae]
MLYSLYDAKTQALSPFRLLAETTRMSFTNPWNPWAYTPWGRAMAAGSDVLESVMRERTKPAWGIDFTVVDDEEYPVERHVVRSRPFCELIHFKRIGAEKRNDPKILLVAPMSGHFATLLRGTVQALIQDHEVYVTDWIDAALVPVEDGHFSLDDYIDYLLDFMRFLAPDLNVMAVCQPAPVTLAAVSLLAQHDDPAQPSTMTLMGGPIDPAAEATVVTQLAENRTMSWFEQHCVHLVPGRFPGANRRVYPGFLQLRAFLSMNPARHTSAHMKMFNHLIEGDGESAAAHRKFYDEYLAVMDTPAEFYLDTIREIFKERTLPRGLFKWRGETVDPSAITKTALLTVEGALDDISAPGQTYAAHDMCTGLPKAKHKNIVQENVGHYGIFNGRRWREQIKPQIGEFIRKHRAA